MAFSIKISENKCTGCRACELACSFHHRRVFNPQKASIAILQSKDKEEIKIVIFYSNEAGHLACDNCKNEREPLCVKYCVWGAIRTEELHGEGDRGGKGR